MNTTYEYLIWASRVDVRCCESSWTDTSYFLALVMIFKLSPSLTIFPKVLLLEYCLLIHHPVLSTPRFVSSLPCFFPLLVSCCCFCELESAYSRLICYFKAICFILSLASNFVSDLHYLIQNSNSQKQLPFVSSNVFLRTQVKMLSQCFEISQTLWHKCTWWNLHIFLAD